MDSRGFALVLGGVAMVLVLTSAFLGGKHFAAKRGWPTWLGFSLFLLPLLAGVAISLSARRHRRTPRTPPATASAIPSTSTAR